MATIKSIGSMDLERGWPYGSHTWKPGMDRNLLKLAYMTNGSAISRTTPIPEDGELGDCYIDPVTGHIVIWERDEDDVAKWLGIAPATGCLFHVEDSQTIDGYLGSPPAWGPVFDPDSAVPPPAPRSMAIYMPGPVIPNLNVFTYPVRVSVDLALDFGGSYGYADADPSEDVVFTVSKNDTDFGTITFATGYQTATFSGSAESFIEGDILRIKSPAQTNGLANVAITLKGQTPGL